MTELALHDGPQTEAYLSTASEILYGGAAGGGKSHLMRVLAISIAFAVRGVQIYLFRRLSGDLIKNHMDGPSGFPALLRDWVDSGAVRVNTSNGKIYFWNNSIIHLCHCQYEHNKYNYQGAEIHVLLIDELTHFTDTIYRFLRNRVRMTGLNVPKSVHWNLPMIVCGSNPGNIGHTWVKSTFITPKKPFVIWETSDEEGGMMRQFIPAQLKDNPALLEVDPGYVKRLRGLGDPALVRAMMEGDWDIVAGGMFDDVWKRDKNIIDAPFIPPPGWRVTRSFDWGSSRPFSIGWWAESEGNTPALINGEERLLPKGSKVRFSEWYGWNGRPNEGCRMTAKDIARGVLKREASMNLLGRVRPGAADPSIFSMEDGRSIASQMSGVGVKFNPAVKGANSRQQGWEIMRNMMKAANEFPIEEPCLLVTENCDQFIRTVPVLPRSERDPEDVNTDAEDHIGDEARYELVKKLSTAKRVGLHGV